MKIKILHVIATLDPAGAENQLTRLVLNLNPARFACQVCCLTRGGPLEAGLAEAGIPYHILHKRGKCDITALLRLMALVRQFRPHILNTWLFTSNAYGRLAALLAGAPLRVAMELSVDGWKWGPYLWVDRLLLPFTDVIVANADAVKRFYMDREGVPASKICVVRNGIDLRTFRPQDRMRARARLRVPADALLVGGAGRLDHQKGFSLLVEAMVQVRRKHPNTLLLIAGEGQERRRLEDLARRLGLTMAVRFLGHLADMPGFMSALDVFALPSLWEGLPHVVMEAMACGCPVVATNVGGVDELVEPGRTGFLVAPRSASDMASAVVRLLDCPELREKMGKEAYHVAHERFDFMNMVREMEDLYLALVGKRGLYG